MFVLYQDTGLEAFIPPILYGSGGSESPHSQPVLLPNGNANVIYRRSFGEPAGPYLVPNSDVLYTGELNLKTGDIEPIDYCMPGSGGWVDCGDYKSPYTEDESSALVRSGDILYLDIARGTVGLDIANEERVLLSSYNTSASPFLQAPIIFYPGHDEWITDYDNILSEVSSDGNDLKRPTPIVGDTFFVFHYNTMIAVKGTIR